MPWPAQSDLQGDIRVPSGALPTVRGVTGGVGVLPPEQHEAQGEAGLGLPGPQQHQRGAAGPLDRDEGGGGTAGLPLAHPHRHIGGRFSKTELPERAFPLHFRSARKVPVGCVLCVLHRGVRGDHGFPVLTARLHEYPLICHLSLRQMG